MQYAFHLSYAGQIVKIQRKNYSRRINHFLCPWIFPLKIDNGIVAGHPLEEFRVIVGSNYRHAMSLFAQKAVECQTRAHGIPIGVSVRDDGNLLRLGKNGLYCSDIR